MENECKKILRYHYQWISFAYLLWSAPLIYTALYLILFLSSSTQSSFSFFQFFRVYLLLVFLMSIKYMTLSFFPDVSSSIDEIRKLFTSVTYSHGLIFCSSVIYNVLFSEIASILFYPRLHQWSGFLGNITGIVSSTIYLLRHDYITYWFDPPFPRTNWLIRELPNVALMSLICSLISLTLSNTFWLFFKHEFGGFDSTVLSMILIFLDYLLTKMMQNFLAKPCYLDDQDYLGEEVAISGLLLKDTEVHFQCLNDLNRANSSRMAGLMEAKASQWSILLELGLDYVKKVPNHIKSYSGMKMKEKEIVYKKVNDGLPKVLSQVSTMLYFVFNEPFDVRFRNQLFKLFTMAALSSKVLTKFVVNPGLSSFIVRNDTLGLIVQAQAECLIELEKYRKVDPAITSNQFALTLRRDLMIIRECYSEYIRTLSLSAEVLELVFNRI